MLRVDGCSLQVSKLAADGDVKDRLGNGEELDDDDDDEDEDDDSVGVVWVWWEVGRKYEVWVWDVGHGGWGVGVGHRCGSLGSTPGPLTFDMKIEGPGT